MGPRPPRVGSCAHGGPDARTPSRYRARMTRPIELHGLRECPFAWRTRIAARLKGVPFEWLPYDALADDARDAKERSATHNPDKKSPLLWQDGWSLIESSVICAYLDEANAGPALQPSDVRARAEARVAVAEVGGLMTNPHADLDDATRKRVAGAMAKLDQRLADGRAWFDGTSPGLVDAHVWPALAALEKRGVVIADQHARLRAYWAKARAHEAFVATKP